MKIVTIVGARPQFIKAAVVSRAFLKTKNIQEIIIHTGQHFDTNMSDVFFEEMKIPKPKYNLGISGLSHGAMTGEMLKGIEEILLAEKPEWVLVYGDTNSTLAGALAASKLSIKIAHVEAGLRSFNMRMPEEINRILTDRLSTILFCPTNTAVQNLKKEGFENFNSKIVNSGDVMLDAVHFYSKLAPENKYNEDYLLATIHRAENTDSLDRLRNIFKAFQEIRKKIKIILPLHPRTKKIIIENQIDISGIDIIEPVGYFEMLTLLKNCNIVATDSGGLQKESFFFQKPCLILRDETEWTELLSMKGYILTGAKYETMVNSFKVLYEDSIEINGHDVYGDGSAGEKIASTISEY